MSSKSPNGKHDDEGYESETGSTGGLSSNSTEELFSKQSLLGNFILLHHKGHGVLIARPRTVSGAKIEARVNFSIGPAVKVFLAVRIRKMLIEITNDDGWKAVTPFSSVFVTLERPLALHWKAVELKDVTEKLVSVHKLKHHTLKDLRNRIEKEQHIPSSDQCLVLSGVRIDDNKTLATPATKIYVGSYSRSE